MKKIFNLFLAMSMFFAATFQFSPKVAAKKDPPGVLTPSGKVFLFLTRFNELAHTYVYDEALVDEQESHIKLTGKDDFDILCDSQERSLNMLNNHHKGVCRNFMFAVEKELSNLKIKNWLVFDMKQYHGFNIYIDPVDGEPKVADLTYQLNYTQEMAAMISFVEQMFSDFEKQSGCGKQSDCAKEQEIISRIRNSLGNALCYVRVPLEEYVRDVLIKGDKSFETEGRDKKIEEEMINRFDSLYSDPEQRERAKRTFVIRKCLEKLFPTSREEQIILYDSSSYDSSMTLKEFKEKLDFDNFYKNYQLAKSFS